MSTTIKQKVTFSISEKKLYRFYMDATLHEKITGTKTKIEKGVGSKFSAGDGFIKGKILHLKPNKMIVQTWRGKNWDQDAMDSILVLIFNEVDENTSQLEMVHVNVPDEHTEEIKKGWNEHYWKPWNKYIQSLKK